MSSSEMIKVPEHKWEIVEKAINPRIFAKMQCKSCETICWYLCDTVVYHPEGEYLDVSPPCQ